MEIGWLSTDGPRFKVGVHGEAMRGYQKLKVFPRFHAEGLGSRKLRVQEVFAELPRVIAHASRDRYFSYFGLFSILGAVWLSFNAIRGCLALFALRGYLEN